MATTIPAEVLDVLKRSDIGHQFLRLPKGSLSRDVYVSVAKVCEAHGGKWNRNLKGIAWIGTDNTSGLIEAMNEGKYTDHQKELGYFPTPADLAERMVNRALIAPYMTNNPLILEPSAGNGALVEAAYNVHGSTCWINAIEIDAGRCATLRGEREAYNLPLSVMQADFLTLAPDPVYDVVLMNPPFSGQGCRDLDASHILHAWKFLKPGGRLVSIAGAGLTSKMDGKAIVCRHMVQLARGTIEELPEHSFKVSGTHVATVMVTVDKPAN
jgi:predicted RNA methylase